MGSPTRSIDYERMINKLRKENEKLKAERDRLRDLIKDAVGEMEYCVDFYDAYKKIDGHVCKSATITADTLREEVINLRKVLGETKDPES